MGLAGGATLLSARVKYSISVEFSVWNSLVKPGRLSSGVEYVVVVWLCAVAVLSIGVD